MKIKILKGLPGSGKTTYAKQLIADDPSWVRVNKDEIRLVMLPKGWSELAEKKAVIPERNRRILAALKAGNNVIVDDTNIAPKHERDIRALVTPLVAYGDIEVQFFDTPIEECVARDAQRTGSAHVGESVIRRFASQLQENAAPVIVKYQPTPGLPDCIISDLDGTLSLHEGIRNVYDGSKCHLDKVNTPVKNIINVFSATPDLDVTIVYMSGRDDEFRPQTIEFLLNNGIAWQEHLYMRAAGDRRKDNIVKQELFDKYVRGKFNVLFVLDDRDAVVKLWRDLGLACLQVNYGNF